MAGVLSLLTAPAALVVTVAEAKAQSRQSSSIGTAEDAQIARLIAAATARAENETGRQLITATYRLDLPGWFSWLELPKPPAIAVTGITYLDTAGVWQTWAPANYQTRLPAGPHAPAGIVAPAYGAVFPSLQTGALDAVRVTFTAGYGAAPTAVPADILQAILLMVATWYDERANVSQEGAYASLPLGSDRLLRPYWWRPTVAD